jgi:DNA repair protein RadC
VIEQRARQVGRIDNPRDAGWVLEPLGMMEVQEVACVMNLDVHCGFAGVREVGRGDIDQVGVPPHLAIRAANFNGTPWAILSHNHPSGDPRPSPDDVALWRDAEQRFRSAGLHLLDHMIIGRGAFYSCKWGQFWYLTQ